MLSYDRPPLSFLERAGGEGRGRRSPFDVEGLPHDRLAAGLGLRPRADRAGVCRRERQQRLAASSSPFKRPRPRRSTTIRFRVTVRAKYERRLKKLVDMLTPLRLQLQDARRHVFPLHALAEGTQPAARRSKPPKRAASILITEHSIAPCPGTTPGHSLRFSVTYEAPDEAAEDALMAETEKAAQKQKPVF